MLEALRLPIVVSIAFVFFIIFAVIIFKREMVMLAAKNLLKNRRRTIILLCVITSGLTGVILFFGYAEESLYNLQFTTIKSGLGHVQLYKKGYNKTGNVDKLKYSIPNYQELKEKLYKDPWLKDKIKCIGADLSFSGIIASEQTSSVFIGKGIEVDKDQLLSSADELVDGKKLEPSKENYRIVEEKSSLNEFEGMFDYFTLEGVDKNYKKNSQKDIQKGMQIWSNKTKKFKKQDKPSIDDALIGNGLQTALKVSPGNTLTMMVATKTGALNALDVNVRGVIRGFAKEYNDSILKIPLKYAWVLLNKKDVSRVLILLKDNKYTNPVYNYIQNLIKKEKLDLEVTDWYSVAYFYQKVRALYTAIFISMGVIITIVVFFSITNVMTMSVMERVRQIGTLRAIGETKFGIMQLFLLEAILIGAVGGILSVITGIGIAEFVNKILGGIPHPPPPGGSVGFRAFLFVVERPVIWGLAFLLSFVSSFVSSLLPAKRAADMDVVDSLRFT